jgi:hypothetical protein
MKQDALEDWKIKGGVRPAKRVDGCPTRIDLEWYTEAERAIYAAMFAVEQAGASRALTDAVTLLAQAQDRVADHVEGAGESARPASEDEDDGA